MAGTVNKVILVGNVGKDPEVRTTQNGDKIVNLSLATSETWNDRVSGERKERTEWHRVVIFNEGLADLAEKYVRKGTKLYVEGALQTRKWTDQSGQERYATEVILAKFRGTMTMLSRPDNGASSGASAAGGAGGSSVSYQSGTQRMSAGAPAGASMGAAPSMPDLDDEIPF